MFGFICLALKILGFISTFIALLILSVILSTSYEIYLKRFNSQTIDSNTNKLKDYKQLLISFSIVRNTRLLFIKTSKFEALDTIRFLLIFHGFLLHEYVLAIMIIIPLKNIASTTNSILYDNKYVFIRNMMSMDALFTLR